MNPLIKSPCHEDWNLMTPTEKGRHCLSCDKEVNDLTTKSPVEISTFLAENGANKICIRVRTEPPTSFVIPEKRWIRTAPKWQHFLLAIALAFFGGELSAQTKGKLYIPEKKAEIKRVKLINERKIPDKEPLDNDPITKDPGIHTTITGELSADYYRFDTVSVFDFAEVPAEFPGGPREMMSFIQKNLVVSEITEYPGTSVYATFEVDRQGKISNAHILKGINKKLNEEILRIISVMPNWNPGKNLGVPVNSWVKIPVRIDFR